MIQENGKKCSKVNLVYIIWGNPIPKASARVGKTRVWDAQKHLKLDCRLKLEEQHQDRELYEGALRMEVTFFMPIPESMSFRKREGMVGRPHKIKPDTSNLLKFIEDVCTTILYKDDCQISSTYATKIYDLNPRIEFSIIELE